MRKIILPIYRFFYRRNYYVAICILFFLLLILPTIVTLLITLLFNDNSVEEVKEETLFLTASIISPFFETFIFQYLLLWFLRFLKIKSVFVIILIASTIFGILHFNSIGYVLMAFVAGLIYNFTYIFSFKRFKKEYIAFLIVFLMHMLNNTLALLSTFIG